MRIPIGLAAVAGRLRSGRFPVHQSDPLKKSSDSLTILIRHSLEYVDKLSSRSKQKSLQHSRDQSAAFFLLHFL